MSFFYEYALAFIMGIWLLGYICLSIFTVIWALKLGDSGIHKEMTFMSSFLYWHGVAVLAAIVLSAAGSFIILFGKLALKGY